MRTRWCVALALVAYSPVAVAEDVGITDLGTLRPGGAYVSLAAAISERGPGGQLHLDFYPAGLAVSVRAIAGAGPDSLPLVDFSAVESGYEVALLVGIARGLSMRGQQQVADVDVMSVSREVTEIRSGVFKITETYTPTGETRRVRSYTTSGSGWAYFGGALVQDGAWDARRRYAGVAAARRYFGSTFTVFEKGRAPVPYVELAVTHLLPTDHNPHLGHAKAMPGGYVHLQYGGDLFYLATTVGATGAAYRDPMGELRVEWFARVSFGWGMQL